MIIIEKARYLRSIIERAILELDLPPEEALEVVDLYPNWENDKSYAAGDRVKHDGKLYECFQDHKSQLDWMPNGGAVSLWGEVTVDPATGYDEWKQPTGAHDAYNIGDRILYNGEVYESLIDGNVYSPEAYPAGWKKL